MIVCVTPNPALDRTVGVTHLVPGEVARATWEHEVAGGKGLNVARVLWQLGRAASVCGPLGGPTGDRIADLAAAEGLPARWVPIAGESRTCDVIVEHDGRSTVVNGGGPLLSDVEWDDLIATVRDLASIAELVTISGSLPGGAVSGLERLVGAALSCGAPVWVDTSDGSLASLALRAELGLKINRAEAVARVGGVDAIDTAVQLLASSGALAVVVTDGAAGAVHATRDDVWWCGAPAVDVVNATGSGDAFFAGLVDAVAGGAPAPLALQAAVAAGAAAALQRTATLEPGDLRRLAALTPAPVRVDRTSS